MSIRTAELSRPRHLDLDVHLAIGCGEQVRTVVFLLHQPVDTVYLAGHRVGVLPFSHLGAIILGG